MAELKPAEVAVIYTGLVKKARAGLDDLLEPLARTAGATAPGLRAGLILSTAGRMLHFTYMEICIVVGIQPEPWKHEHAAATALVLARYMLDEAKGGAGFNVEEAWKSALSDVERLKRMEPKQ